MNRTTILVVALTGALGLAIGWTVSGERTKPTLAPPPPHKPPSAVGHVGPSQRHEFPLRPEDLANDRETPALAADAQGRVVLAWAAQSGPLERTLYLARSNDGGKTFDEPAPFRKVPIYRYASRGKNQAMTYSTHVLPRLAATSDCLYLGWVEAIDGGPKVAYYIARSTDGGKTFADPVRVHGDDASRAGFTTLAATADGTLLAAWLDGRNQGQQPFLAVKPEHSEGFLAERLVYAGPEGKGICPCCDVAAVRLPDGSDVVAFRNNDSGYRDIWLAQAKPGRAFDRAVPLALTRWTFEGCPHDAPSLVLDGKTIHAAWMSAHSGKNRVYVASSPASELSFTARELSKGTPGAQGHPKLVVARPGAICAVWDESLDPAAPAPSAHNSHEGGSRHGHGHGPTLSGSGRAIMLARGTSEGFGPAHPIAPSDGAFQLNPAIAVSSDGALVVAWSEIDTSGKRIVLVRTAPDAESH